MYKKSKPTQTTLVVNRQYEGETMEEKVRRILNNKEPIDDVAQRIYTERKDGVLPDYNIRTDRWDVALNAMDKVTGSHLAKREARQKSTGEQAKEGMDKESKTENKKDSGGPAPIQGTDKS